MFYQAKKRAVHSRAFTPLEITGNNGRQVASHKFLTGFTPLNNFAFGKIAVKRHLTGFTLIELLVVIAIIGLLATIVTVSVNNARKKARDAKRIGDIKQLQTALDLYYDQYGAFPVSGNCGATSPNTGWCNSIQSLSIGHWVRNGTTNLATFLPQDPLDPKQGSSPSWLPIDGGTYFYYANSYGGAGQWYMIVFGLENYPHPMEQQDGVTASDGTYFHYGSGSNGIITIGRNKQN